jgi:hypothetical protein
MIDELMTWGRRLFAILPEFMSLFQAAKAEDPKAKMDAAMAMIRATERLIAEEEISGR